MSILPSVLLAGRGTVGGQKKELAVAAAHFASSTVDAKIREMWEGWTDESREAALSAVSSLLNQCSSASASPETTRFCVTVAATVVLAASTPSLAGRARQLLSLAAGGDVLSEILRILPEEARSMRRAMSHEGASSVDSFIRSLAEGPFGVVAHCSSLLVSSSPPSSSSSRAAVCCLKSWAEFPGISYDVLEATGVMSAIFTVIGAPESDAGMKVLSFSLISEIVAGDSTARDFARRPSSLVAVFSGMLQLFDSGIPFSFDLEEDVQDICREAMKMSEVHFSDLPREIAVRVVGLAARISEHPRRAVVSEVFPFVSELHSLRGEGSPSVDDSALAAFLPFLRRIASGLRRHSTELAVDDADDLVSFRELASPGLASLHALAGKAITADLFLAAPSNWPDVDAMLWCLQSIAPDMDEEESSLLVSHILTPLLPQVGKTIPSNIATTLFSLVAAFTKSLAANPATHQLLVQCATLAAETLRVPALSKPSADVLTALSEIRPSAEILAAAVLAGSPLCTTAFSNCSEIELRLRADVTRATCRIAKLMGPTGISTVITIASGISTALAAAVDPVEAASHIDLIAEIAASFDGSGSPVALLHAVAWPSVSKAVHGLAHLRPKKRPGRGTSCDASGDTVSSASHLLGIEFVSSEGASPEDLLRALGDLCQCFVFLPRSCVLITASVAAQAISWKLPAVPEFFAAFLNAVAPVCVSAGRPGLLGSLFDFSAQLARHQPPAIFAGSPEGCSPCVRQLFADAISAVSRTCSGSDKETRACCSGLRFLTAFVECSAAHQGASKFITDEGAGRQLCAALVSLLSTAPLQWEEPLGSISATMLSLVDWLPDRSRTWLTEFIPTRPDAVSHILQAKGKGTQHLQEVLSGLAKH